MSKKEIKEEVIKDLDDTSAVSEADVTTMIYNELNKIFGSGNQLFCMESFSRANRIIKSVYYSPNNLQFGACYSNITYSLNGAVKVSSLGQNYISDYKGDRIPYVGGTTIFE